MYRIDRTKSFLQVQFKADFDYSTLKQLLYNELTLPEFSRLNDMWLIGKYRAHLRLGDVQSIVDDFGRLCPDEACQKKMAIVVKPGLTSAILQLMADSLDRRLPFACRVFDSQAVAEDWIGMST